MELHQLRYFVAVADTGGFCKAAGACRVAQPSLSQQIRRLEQSVGARLFDRLGRTTVLTDAGRELLPRARRILAEVRDARQHLSDPSGAARLAIGAIPTIAPFVLPAIMAAIQRRCPGCEIVIREDYTEHVLAGVASAELDVCIIASPPEHPALIGEPIAEDPFMLATPKNHLLAQRRHVSVADLEQESFVVLHEVHCLGRQVGELCRAGRVQPCVVSTMTQLATALALVDAGMGVTIIPRLCVPAARARRLPVIPLRGDGSSRPITTAWHRERTRSGAASVLHDTLRSTLASHAAGKVHSSM